MPDKDTHTHTQREISYSELRANVLIARVCVFVSRSRPYDHVVKLANTDNDDDDDTIK